MTEFSPIPLYKEFEASDYGKDLRQKSRFGTFKPPWTPTKLWTEILGDDVNNLYHMPHTYDIAKRFALYEGMREAETNRLLITAITHDIGEAKIGDIPLPDKTAADESAERLAYQGIARELWGAKDGDQLTSQVWSVLGHEDEAMADRFRAIEYIGYCTTAMRAGLVATRLAYGLQKAPVSRVENDQLVSGLSGLETMVRTHNYPVLAGYVEKYPSIPDQLKDEVA